MTATSKCRPLVAVIDDERDITTYYRMVLEDCGLRVTTSNSAATAMDDLCQDPPDVICLDLLMPGQMGVSLYHAIKAHPDLRAVPVLILSGLGHQKELEQIFDAPAIRHKPEAILEKPIEAEAFRDAVRALLQRREIA